MKDPSAWQVAIYPFYAWAPVLGASVKFPSLPNTGSGGGTGPLLSGSTSGSLNGAAFFGGEVQKSKWSLSAQVLYAAVSGDRSTPKVHIGVDFIYGQLMVGRELLPGLTMEGGFRRIALSIGANIDDNPGVSAKPGVWDPLIGMSYRKVLGKKWRIHAHVDGGGFGVGADQDIGAEVRADWRFAKHFGVAMGAGAMHLTVSKTISGTIAANNFSRTLTLSQTLWGPLVGFGIYF